jgi:very-short-patch-repair endonuclease
MKGQTNQKLLRAKLQQKLRRNPTDAEQRLWKHLRARQMGGFRFRRQHPYGDYVLDFVCLEAMLVIEVDGGQHDAQSDQDEARTAVLNAAGFTVLRFWNNEVLNETEAVKEAIWRALKAQNPSPSRPSP